MAKRVLIVKLVGEKEMKVSVPSDSKVTFGPAIPGPSRGMRGYGGSAMEYALRVYNGKTEKSGLLAVFTGVREFKDETIETATLVIREAGKSLWKSDESGYETTTEVKKSKALIPDSF